MKDMPAPSAPFLNRVRDVQLPPVLSLILWRLLRGIVVLWLLSILAFALVQALPGSPVDVMAGPYADAATRARLSADLGLDRPIVTQYFAWVSQILRGNFGTSIFTGLPVSELIQARLGNTLELAVAATFVSVLWGVPLGALAALHHRGWIDRIARAGTFLGLATPVFVLGVVLVLAASTWVPGWPTLEFVAFTADPVQNLKAIMLPALALGLPLGSTICRYMRTSMLDIYEQDYMRTALATGATRFGATLRHGMRNASAPVVTIAGLQMAGLIGESVLIENVFAIPGIGQLTVQSLLKQDYAAAQACLLLLGAIYVLLNLVVDLIYPLLDPKVGVNR